MTVDATALYASSWEALNAAARAAKAEVCGANLVHPSNPRMGGRAGCGIWVTDDRVAERMAEGVTTPRPVVAPCDRCRRPIYVGRPYVMVRPGVFAHRGPCQVVR